MSILNRSINAFKFVSLVYMKFGKEKIMKRNEIIIVLSFVLLICPIMYVLLFYNDVILTNKEFNLYHFLMITFLSYSSLLFITLLSGKSINNFKLVIPNVIIFSLGAIFSYYNIAKITSIIYLIAAIYLVYTIIKVRLFK